MPHCDDETLSLLALGEPAQPEVEDHLHTCSRCAGELTALRRVVTAARDVVEPVPLALQLVAPPARVWDQIAAATGVQAVPRPDEVLRNAAPFSEPAPASGPDLEPEPEPDVDPGVRPRAERAPGSKVPRPRNRSRSEGWRRGPVLVVAAVSLIFGLLAGGIGTWLVTGRTADVPGRTVVAATRLDGLPLAPSAVGQASVVQTPDGRHLDLDVHRLGIPDGFYEVWLIDPTVTKMVPVGVLRGSQGRFTLPDGVDLKNYPVVDISIQPLDGDPKHSGKSVLRGTLTS